MIPGFKKGENIVLLQGFDSIQFIQYYCYKQREDRNILSPYKDSLDSTTNMWSMINYEGKDRTWRYATENEIYIYEMCGKPFDTREIHNTKVESNNKLSKFPQNGFCRTRDIRLLEHLKNSSPGISVNNFKNDSIGIAWNTVSCWLISKVSGQPEYKLSELEPFFSKKEITDKKSLKEEREFILDKARQLYPIGTEYISESDVSAGMRSSVGAMLYWNALYDKINDGCGGSVYYKGKWAKIITRNNSLESTEGARNVPTITVSGINYPVANQSGRLLELANTKIWIGDDPNLCSKVQEKLFELDSRIKHQAGPDFRKIKHTTCKFFYISKDYYMGGLIVTSKDYFNNMDCPEIKLSQLGIAHISDYVDLSNPGYSPNTFIQNTIIEKTSSIKSKLPVQQQPIILKSSKSRSKLVSI